ncbi:uncharacterized protein LOC119268946 isoform X1 [Triticum dicoccoides]|uniref:uncharacterized protein LOC119268946 isoform X1 n=1 Tax=Triticum dicoccoides TaxID=85692 RepID=UPI00188E95AB|nr:uncharacterized protein LOC119268946 isoform X1 [Triticum dicoccoides]XP_044341235.1 uncharacterized protein LOC123062003 isoform X2 [Triticum aestivum]
MSAALGVEGWPEAAPRRAVRQEASRRVTASPAGGRVAVRIDPQPPSLLVAMARTSSPSTRDPLLPSLVSPLLPLVSFPSSLTLIDVLNCLAGRSSTRKSTSCPTAAFISTQKGCSTGLGHAEISATIDTDKAQLSIAYSEESNSCRQSRHYDR